MEVAGEAEVLSLDDVAPAGADLLWRAGLEVLDEQYAGIAFDPLVARIERRQPAFLGAWGLQLRLGRESTVLCGIRAINNIVDATNYVLLECGHPMHAFDLTQLAGSRVIVRTAADGEEFKTLDGQTHKLTSDMLIIADQKRSVALAGIMGGENSATLDTTTDIFLESAYFEPVSIRKTAKKLGIRTESSYRFERTADWGITTAAIERATEIIMMTCSPKASKIRDEYVNVFKDKIVTVREDFVSSKLGVEISIKEIEAIMKRLRYPVVAKREDSIEVKIPSFRSDVSRQIDIVEEVARIYGYNTIPQNAFKPPLNPGNLQPKKDIGTILRATLQNQGYTEGYHYSFMSEDDIKKFQMDEASVLRLQNPLSSDASVMRNYLFGWLLRTVEYNVKNAYIDEIRLFELGRTFVREQNTYKETRKLGIVLYGKGYDFYSISGISEHILRKTLKSPVEYRKSGKRFMHPVNSAEILLEGIEIGFLGEVHPDITEKLDLKYPVYIAEIETDALSRDINNPIVLKPVPKFPPVTRDLSVVVSSDIYARDILNRIPGLNPLIQSVEFVDIFQGVQIGEKKKSLTFAINFLSAEKTLTDTEVNAAMQTVVDDLGKKFSAELR